MTDTRVQYSSEAAVTMVENRFDLVLIAATRVRELKNGHKSTLGSKSGPVTTTLREIEQGLIGREYLKRVRENARAGK
jgi:DNA-directed RNA polymerase omega subunit